MKRRATHPHSLVRRSWAATVAVLVATTLLVACQPGTQPNVPAVSPAPSVAPAANTAAELTVWALGGMERVGREAPAGPSQRIELYAARGETEPFQVAVRAGAAGLTGVDLSVSDLRGPDGATINADNLTLYREHYVEVRHPSPDDGGSNRPLGAGWYADALIPFERPTYQAALPDASLRAVPVDVLAGQNQPFWIDLFVPRDAVAGDYTGSFTLNSDQGSVTGEVALHVWNFELPLRPALLSSFDLEDNDTLGNIKELLRHRLMPEKVAPEYQRELIDDWGLGTTDVRGFWSGANNDTCAMKQAPEIAKLREALEGFQNDLLIYNYTADEIDNCPSLVAPLIEWSANLREAGIANMVTMAPTDELLQGGQNGSSAVDIWVLLAKRYVANEQLVEAARERGTQLWSYNAGVQEGYSPKWQIDFAPVNFRIQPGFISQSLGLTGMLYWRLDNWTADPWRDVGTYNNGKITLSGDGMFVYPGEQVGIDGVVPSLRLKWIREGVDDYDYVALLKARGQGDYALQVARSVGADWRNWTQDVETLEQARRQLGEALSQTPAAAVQP